MAVTTEKAHINTMMEYQQRKPKNKLILFPEILDHYIQITPPELIKIMNVHD